MVPGVCMRALESFGVRSIVLTSGTLSPLESFAHELVRPRRGLYGVAYNASVADGSPVLHSN
jgi:hypothetical protein